MIDTKGIPSFRDYLSNNPVKSDAQVPVNLEESPTPQPILSIAPVQIIDDPIKPAVDAPSPYSIAALPSRDGAYRMEIPDDKIDPATGQPIVEQPVIESVMQPHIPQQPRRRSSLVPDGFIPAPEQPVYAPAPGQTMYPRPMQPSMPHNMMYPQIQGHQPVPMGYPPGYQQIPRSAIVPPGRPIPTYAPEQMSQMPQMPQDSMPINAVPRMELPPQDDFLRRGMLPPSTANGPMITSSGQIVATEQITPMTHPPIPLTQPPPLPQHMVAQMPIPIMPAPQPAPQPIEQPAPQPIEHTSPIIQQIQSLTGVIDISTVNNIIVVTTKYQEKTPSFNTLSKKIKGLASTTGMRSTLVSA